MAQPSVREREESQRCSCRSVGLVAFQHRSSIEMKKAISFVLDRTRCDRGEGCSRRLAWIHRGSTRPMSILKEKETILYLSLYVPPSYK
jgi:hypothetical protein